jgi:ElaB/YqjD/DUF883 family membrane-anchored ribosome-binding protein
MAVPLRRNEGAGNGLIEVPEHRVKAGAKEQPMAETFGHSRSDGEDASLRRLEREAELNRADLVNTVDELRSRVTESVSPDNIKQDVKEYLGRTSQDIIENFKERARENPLQTVAIGAAVALPAWRLLRSIPISVLLLGAGIALSGRAANGSTKSRGERLLNEVTDRATRVTSAAASYSWSHLPSSVGQVRFSRTGQAWRGVNLWDLANKHPLVTNGIGLLMGAVVGACLAASGRGPNGRSKWSKRESPHGYAS